MKTTRVSNYIGTFQNTDEGNSRYKSIIKKLRLVLSGGTFMKMFRGSKRKLLFHFPDGSECRSGSSSKKGSTHFDVYFQYPYIPICQRTEKGLITEINLNKLVKLVK